MTQTTQDALFERIELVDDPTPCGAAMNMAIDEALLHALTHAPILRLYRWAAPAVSIGCFEPAAAVRAAYAERELVRRWTGGGVVEHGADLTYSLLAPRTLPVAAMRPGESYQLIHAAVARALARAGVGGAELENTLGQNEASTARACFEKPVPFDVLANGRKVAGAAQRRTRWGLLHQGSILFDLPAGTSAPGEPLHRRLAEELARAFGDERERRDLSPPEQRAAERLAAAKYGAESWTRKF